MTPQQRWPVGQFSHVTFRELLEAACPDLTPLERWFVQCICALETRYGKQITGECKAKGLYQFGNVHASDSQIKTGITCSGLDAKAPDAAGKSEFYTTRFIAHTDPLIHARATARRVLKGGVRDAIARRDLEGAIDAMKATGYFEASLSAYKKGVDNVAVAINEAYRSYDATPPLQTTPAVADDRLYWAAASKDGNVALASTQPMSTYDARKWLASNPGHVLAFYAPARRAWSSWLNELA
jgi:hypothetical protein